MGESVEMVWTCCHLWPISGSIKKKEVIVNEAMRVRLEEDLNELGWRGN